MRRLICEALILVIVERTVDALNPALLPYAWLMILAVLVWELFHLQSFTEPAARFYSDLSKIRKFMSFIVIGAFGAVIFCGCWAIINKVFSSHQSRPSEITKDVAGPEIYPPVNTNASVGARRPLPLPALPIAPRATQDPGSLLRSDLAEYSAISQEFIKGVMGDPYRTPLQKQAELKFIIGKKVKWRGFVGAMQDTNGTLWGRICERADRSGLGITVYFPGAQMENLAQLRPGDPVEYEGVISIANGMDINLVDGLIRSLSNNSEAPAANSPAIAENRGSIPTIDPSDSQGPWKAAQAFVDDGQTKQMAEVERQLRAGLSQLQAAFGRVQGAYSSGFNGAATGFSLDTRKSHIEYQLALVKIGYDLPKTWSKYVIEIHGKFLVFLVKYNNQEREYYRTPLNAPIYGSPFDDQLKGAMGLQLAAEIARGE